MSQTFKKTNKTPKTWPEGRKFLKLMVRYFIFIYKKLIASKELICWEVFGSF